MINRPSLSLFLTLVGITALGPMAVQLYIPSVPSIIKELNLTLSTAQIAFSSSLVTMGISMLFYGPLSDRYGRKLVLLCGTIIFIVGSLIASISTDIYLLILGRTLQSIGGAGGFVISRAIVRDLYGPKNAPRVLATLITVFIIAPMVGVIFGGIITDYLGWRFIFYLSAVIGLIVLILIFIFLRKIKQPKSSLTNVRSMFKAYFSLMKSPTFLGFALQGAFAPGAFMSFMAVGPYILINDLNRPATEFGLLFGLVTLIFMGANYIGGRISTPLGIEKSVVIGAVVALISSIFGLTLLLVFGLTVLIMFGTQTFSSIGNGLAMPNSQVGALNVNPNLSGTASGAAAFIQTMIGAIFAQSVSGFQSNTDQALFIATFIAAFGSFIFGLIPFIIVNRKIKNNI
tara:strand:+ start:618 stop:1820 length:1203 start_codon:yes stop_codon:yes gene_type:complete